MALDLLGRLDERDTDAAEELADADKRIGQLECEVESLEAEQARLNDECDAPTAQLTELEEALGADGPEEAIAMARTLREAFE
jgi:chromosome segregation ATPase